MECEQKANPIIIGAITCTGNYTILSLVPAIHHFRIFNGLFTCELTEQLNAASVAKVEIVALLNSISKGLTL